MTLDELRTYKIPILALTAEHGVGNVRVFGSVVRGESDAESDIDFLVSIETPLGWKYFALQPALATLLGCDVEVVTDNSA